MRTSGRYADDACLDPTEACCKVLSFSHDPPPLRRRLYPPNDLAMVRQFEAACHYGSMVERLAGLHGLLPSMIAGLGSRQSGWGLDFSPTGPEGSKDFVPRLHHTKQRQHPMPRDGAGFARGLMLLDYDRHDIARNGDWRDPEANINAACLTVIDYQHQLRRQTTLQGPGLLRASFAAFDCGIVGVWHALRQGLDVDHPTKGGNYGRDILLRAGFFQAHGWD